MIFHSSNMLHYATKNYKILIFSKRTFDMRIRLYRWLSETQVQIATESAYKSYRINKPVLIGYRGIPILNI